jgi:O-antigen/teichoic acid export membrane protein
VLSISAAVAYQTDNIVIAHILGADEVPQYAIPMQLFLIAPLLLAFVLIPLWPAYGDALARGEHAWIERTFVRSLKVAVAIGGAISFATLILIDPLLNIWVGDSITPPLSLLVGLAVWGFLNCVSGSFSMLLNGTNVIGFQAKCAMVMMVANLGLSIALTHTVGISGPVWGSIIAQTACVLLPTLIYVRVLLHRLRDAPNEP